MIRRLVTSRAVVVVTAALLGGALAGWLTWPTPPPRAEGLPAFVPAVAPAAERATSGGPGSSAADRARTDRARADRARRATRARPARPPAPQAPPPRRLRVPSLDLTLPVRPEGVERSGAMALPDTVDAVGWYRYGPRPGDPTGAAVIAGHVDTLEEGIGPLAALADLEVGARVSVDTARGAVDYEVRSVSTIDRADLDLDQLFLREGRPRLHLVTCGGAYLPEQGGYQANLVVVAAPTGGPGSLASGG